jgi:hypothetical protein
MAYDDELDEETETSAPLDPNIRKQLREAEKIRKEAELLRAELTKQKAEVEFTKAGIPDTGIGALFRKAYDGEANAEAIRQAAQEYGLVPETAQAPAVDVTSDYELEALRRTQGASVGTTGVMPAAEQEYLAAIQSATSVEEVMKVVSGDLGKGLGLTAFNQ